MAKKALAAVGPDGASAVEIACLTPAANAQGSGLDEAHKEALLERIKQRFASRKFVSEIVLVPDYYLAGQRGFAGLDGIKRLYGLDVVALIRWLCAVPAWESRCGRGRTAPARPDPASLKYRLFIFRTGPVSERSGPANNLV